jgi:hypothetical protein
MASMDVLAARPDAVTSFTTVVATAETTVLGYR